MNDDAYSRAVALHAIADLLSDMGFDVPDLDTLTDGQIAPERYQAWSSALAKVRPDVHMVTITVEQDGVTRPADLRLVLDARYTYDVDSWVAGAHQAFIDSGAPGNFVTDPAAYTSTTVPLDELTGDLASFGELYDVLVELMGDGKDVFRAFATGPTGII